MRDLFKAGKSMSEVTTNLSKNIPMMDKDHSLNNNQQFEAINIDVKTLSELTNDFKEGLGFDPFDINALAENESKESKVDAYTTEQLLKLCQLQQEMSDVLEQRFIDNMVAFKKYIPNIYEKFKNYKPHEALEFTCTSNGVPNLFLPERNEFFYKTYDPEVLCKKQVDITLEQVGYRSLSYDYQYDPWGQIYFRYINELVAFQKEKVKTKSTPLKTGGCPFVLVLGCGLGYHIGYLYEKIEINNLIVIEPNPDLFFASLHAFDWASLLEFIHQQNLCINLLIGEDKLCVFDDLLRFFKNHGAMLACCMWSLKHYRSPEIDELSDEIISAYHLVFSLMGFIDDIFFEISQGYQNLIDKSHLVLKNVKIPEEFLNIPVCVVANGPSLDNDLDFLRKYQDKVIIIACGSAIETLYNEGIKPLFYACTERVPEVGQNLAVIQDASYLEDVVLLATDIIYPDVAKMFKHQALFGKADESFYWLLLYKNSQKFKDIQPIVMINPLVANMGVAGASFLGFKNIYLFGIDNGTVEEKLHPDSASFYNKIVAGYEEWSKTTLNKIDKGNFGGFVKTKLLYQLCGSIINRCAILFNLQRGTSYINCSNGLKIDSIPAKHSSEINFDHLPNYNRAELLDFIDNKLTCTYSMTQEEQDNFVDHSEFYTVVDRILLQLENVKQANTRQGVAFALQTITEMLGALSNTKICYLAILFHGSINSCFIVLNRMLYLIENEQEAIDAVHEGLKFVRYLLEDVRKIYKYVPHYWVVDHRKYLNGKVGFDHEDSKAPDLPKLYQTITKEIQEQYPNKVFTKRYK